MASVLSRIPLFSTLPSEVIDALDARMARREFAPDAVIVKQGADGDAAYVIISGNVAVRRINETTGLDLTIRKLQEGQIVGEMALLTGRPRTATVVALEATTCAVLERRDFEELLLTHPQAAVRLSQVVALRLDQLEEQMGRGFVNLARVVIDPRVIELLPFKTINQHRVLPISFANNRLTLAMTNPGSLTALDDVRRCIAGVAIEPVAVSDEQFRAFMNNTYPKLVPGGAAKSTEAPKAAEAAKAAEPAKPETAKPVPQEPAPPKQPAFQSVAIRELQLADEAASTADSRTESDTQDAPIIQLANAILDRAIEKGASDIHIEPMQEEVKVRFRVDGVLQVEETLSKKVQLGLVQRIKIQANLDIGEKRMPQDGRISATVKGKPIDFRVSTVPGKWGEKACLRILDKTNTTLGLDKMITHAPTLDLVRQIISQPYGIIYVTGPTGSGKTTTLYSALAELNEPGVNISTAEDPIEYDLPGVTQIQAKSEIKLTFARILRAFLRQDPDIILVGETRDKETAQTAVEAALTGHLVFTTLHTNSAAGAFTRLGEMGIEPFLVSSSTVGVIAQRLARRLCQACKEAFVADETTCRYFTLAPGTKLYRGRGCDKCGGKGLRGRIGIYEVMRMTAPLRQMVGDGKRAEDIGHAAVAGGMLDLRAYSAILLREGLTTVEEVMSVVSVET